ncbi:MAG TPA: GcrA family cell cycle regulator [Patescibacteria group bacterium]|nr:GcrA family cell cycle regulator [Patescibacteria group bacterium]
MSWTDERIALLKKMWKEGKSAAEIAKTLGKGVTRNAVIGKAHRMGLSGRPSPIKKPAAAPKKEKEAAPKKEAVKETRSSKPSAAASSPKMNPMMAREPEDVRKTDKEILPLNGGIPLIDLTERMCKWPIGDPKEDDFTFCGRGIRPGTPYCPDHAAMAYQTSSRSRNPMVANDRRKAPVKEAVVEVEEEVEEVVEDDEDEEVTA